MRPPRFGCWPVDDLLPPGLAAGFLLVLQAKADDAATPAAPAAPSRKADRRLSLRSINGSRRAGPGMKTSFGAERIASRIPPASKAYGIIARRFCGPETGKSAVEPDALVLTAVQEVLGFPVLHLR